MLTREAFKQGIDQIIELEEMSDAISDVISKYGDGYVYIGGNAVATIVRLLSEGMGQQYLSESPAYDKWTDVEYFVYELDCGRREDSSTAVQEADGTIVDFSDADKVYDYMVKQYYKSEEKLK